MRHSGPQWRASKRPERGKAMDETRLGTGAAVTVVTLTQHANDDTLTADDYREIYQEIRGYDETTHNYRVSLDAFVAAVHSTFSKALWSKYHNGQAPLNRTMKNELRAAVGQPALPLTIEEAMQGVDQNAAVVKVGDGTPDRVLLVGDTKPVTICVNGTVTAAHGLVVAAPVTRVTRVRQPYIRPVASVAQDVRRARLAVAWGAVIEAGLAALEEQEGDHE